MPGEQEQSRNIVSSTSPASKVTEETSGEKERFTNVLGLENQSNSTATERGVSQTSPDLVQSNPLKEAIRRANIGLRTEFKPNSNRWGYGGLLPQTYFLSREPFSTISHRFHPSSEVFLDYDIYEDADLFLIEVDVPGVEDLSISIEGDYVFIRGEKIYKQDNQRLQHYYQGRLSGAFEQAIELPPNSDADLAQARLIEGLLRIVIPKRKENLRQINVPFIEEPDLSELNFGQASSNTSEEEVRSETSAIENHMNFNESRTNPNREAYLHEREILERDYPDYLVAYYNGERIALAATSRELTNMIPDEYRQAQLYIKRIGREPIVLRRPVIISVNS